MIAWWENLTPEQMERYGALIDSRVRLLGEYYGRAVEQVRGSDEARAYVFGPPHLPPAAPLLDAEPTEGQRCER